MKRNLLKSALLALMVLVGGNAWADEWSTVWFTDFSSDPQGMTYSVTNGSVDISSGVLFYHQGGGSGNRAIKTEFIDANFNVDSNWQMEFDWGASSANQNPSNVEFSTNSGKAFTITWEKYATVATITDAGDNELTGNLPIDGYNKATMTNLSHFIITGDKDNGIYLTVTNGETTYVENELVSSTFGYPVSFSGSLGRSVSHMALDNINFKTPAVAGFVAAPTGQVTEVKGTNRVLTLASLTSGATIKWSESAPADVETFESWTTYENSLETSADPIYAVATDGTNFSVVATIATGAGKTITLNAPVFAVTNLIANGDVFNPQLEASNDQSNILLSPTTTTTATFNGETITLPYTVTENGTLVVTVSAEGYTSAQAELNVKSDYQKEWSSSDFSTVTSENYSTILGEGWAALETTGRWASWTNTKEPYTYYQHGDGTSNTTVEENIKIREVVLLNLGYGLSRNVSGTEAINFLNTEAGTIAEIKYYNGFGADISSENTAFAYLMNSGEGMPTFGCNNATVLVQAAYYAPIPDAAEPSLIVNGSFEQCDAVAESIGTSGNAQGTDYEAAGWKLAGSGAWCNAAVFAYGSEAQLNGVNIPAIAPEACGEKALGITVGWGAAVTYQSAETVTLPAGEYVLLAYAYNSNNDAQQMASKLAFVPTVGDAYVSAVNSYPSNTWSVDYVTFTLTEETEGKIQIGGGAISGGSGANAKTFFDNIILTNSEGLASAQQKVADANEAIRQAKIAVNAALVEGAALDNPVTAPFIINGTFDQNVNGWTCTGGFQNKALASNQQGDFTVPFFENWNPDAKENKMYQTVQNIPNGVYKLKIAAFVNILADPNESQFVFANNDKVFLTTGDPTFYEVYTKVEDNTLEVGLEQTTATANWMGIDNVSLIYFGNECTVEEVLLAAPRNDYNLALTEANAAVIDEAYVNVTGEERTTLNAAIETTPVETIEGYKAATSTLKDATAAFKNAKASYDALVDANAQINISLPYALASKKPEAKVATTAAAAETAANEVYSALRAYYESNAKAENVEGAEDKTALITNPDATDGNNGWTIEGNMNNPRNTESWTDSEGNNSYMYFDGGNWGGNSWTTTMKQTVTLPIGKYLLTAKGRASANVTTTLSVGEVSTEMAHVGSTGNIFARGWADSFIEFETPNATENEQVEIVVTASANAVHEWFSVGDFRLTKLKSIPTGIETVKAETAQKAIYNLNGQKVMKAQKGLYILNGKKVVVK